MSSRQSGLTLVESAITVAVIAISATIALPPLQAFVERQRSTATLHRLVADMSLARSRAVVQRKQVVVCPRGLALECAADGDWGRGWLVFTDPDGNRQPDDETDVLRVADGPGGGHLRVTSSRPFLRYQVDGRSAHSNLTVHVCAEDALAGQVIVNNHGRARSSRPARPAPCPRG